MFDKEMIRTIAAAIAVMLQLAILVKVYGIV